MFVDLIGKIIEVYVDDMLVKSKKIEDHVKHLDKAFQILRRYRMRLNILKCTFRVTSRMFLGYMVYQRSIDANLEKIKTLIEMRSPQNEGGAKPSWTCSSFKSLRLKANGQMSSLI